MHAIDATASDGGVSCGDASIGRSAEEAPAEPGLRPPSALISGGSRGVGLAIGERLAARGYILTIAARDPVLTRSRPSPPTSVRTQGSTPS